MSRRRRAPRRTFLAAPLVVTAALGAGCGSSEQVYANPGLPDGPKTQPTTEPTATGSAAPDGELAAIPPGGKGRVEQKPDGSCLYFHPEAECPPEVDCNPGPPREPLRVKCPPDGASTR